MITRGAGTGFFSSAGEAVHNGGVEDRGAARDPAAGCTGHPTQARLFALLVVLVLCGCESSQDKCHRLQRAAGSAWDAYAKVLAAAGDQSQRAHDSAKAKVEGDVQKRIDAEAHRQADRLNQAATSAWWRTYDAAQQALCAKDAECLELKRQMAQADVELKDLSARLAAVRGAQAAATASTAEAKRTAEAVPDDFDHGELKPARAASAEAAKACADVEPSG